MFGWININGNPIYDGWGVYKVRLVDSKGSDAEMIYQEIWLSPTGQQ